MACVALTNEISTSRCHHTSVSLSLGCVRRTGTLGPGSGTMTTRGLPAPPLRAPPFPPPPPPLTTGGVAADLTK